MNLTARLEEARKYIDLPEGIDIVGAISLSGALSKVINLFNIEKVIPYEEIPGFPDLNDKMGGKVLLCELSGKHILIFSGRLHLYEGFMPNEIIFSVRLAAYLGIKNFIICNISGSLNSEIKEGKLALIEDHINLMATNPLIGPNEAKIGPRFPSMHEPYNLDYIKQVKGIGEAEGIEINSGVYAGVYGPSVETNAEYAFLKKIGADFIGMSTVMEIIGAVHAGMNNIAFTIISDQCYELPVADIDISAVKSNVKSGTEKLMKILSLIINNGVLK